MPDAPANPFDAERASFRDTAKWLVGGVFAAAAVAVGTSPLSGLGALEPGPRLYIALLAGGFAIVFMGSILWDALSIIAADTSSLHEVVKNTEAAKVIEGRIGQRIPDNAGTLAELERRITAAWRQRQQDRPRFEALRDRYDEFKPLLALHFARYRFLQFRSQTALLLTLAAIGFLVFAWAANPGSREVTSGGPTYDRLHLAPTSPLAAALDPNCYAVQAGTLVAPVVVLSSRGDGSSELVTLPKDGCKPTRLGRQGRYLFVRK